MDRRENSSVHFAGAINCNLCLILKFRNEKRKKVLYNAHLFIMEKLLNFKRKGVKKFKNEVIKQMGFLREKLFY